MFFSHLSTPLALAVVQLVRPPGSPSIGTMGGGPKGLRRRDCLAGSILLPCPSRRCRHGARCAYAWHKPQQTSWRDYDARPEPSATTLSRETRQKREYVPATAAPRPSSSSAGAQPAWRVKRDGTHTRELVGSSRSCAIGKAPCQEDLGDEQSVKAPCHLDKWTLDYDEEARNCEEAFDGGQTLYSGDEEALGDTESQQVRDYLDDLDAERLDGDGTPGPGPLEQQPAQSGDVALAPAIPGSAAWKREQVPPTCDVVVPQASHKMLFSEVDVRRAGPALRSWLIKALEDDFGRLAHPSFYAAWSSEEVLCDELFDLSQTHPTAVALYIAACRELKLQTASLAGAGDSWKPLQALLGSVTQQGACIRLVPSRDVARTAVRWLEPLLALLRPHQRAHWHRGQALLQEACPEEERTQDLLAFRGPLAAQRLSPRKRAQGLHIDRLWGKKQQKRKDRMAHQRRPRR